MPISWFGDMQYAAIAQLLILLTLANGTPVIAKRIFGAWLSTPLDGGMKFIDGRPVFGPSKTIRGIPVSIVATILGALALGRPPEIGALVALAAMGGDLFSSFIKRRLAMPTSSRAIGLDQIPESLFPLLAVSRLFSLTYADILLATAVFSLGELLLSRILFRLKVRDRPY